MMRDNLDKIAITIKNANPGLIGFSFLIYLLAVIIMGLRLVKILSVQGLKLSAKEGVYLCLLGYFFNNFLPTAIGGDLVKAYYAGKRFNKKAAAFSAVFMDRLLAMLPFTFIPTCAILFMHKKIDNPGIVILVLLMFVLSVSLLAILLSKKTALLFKFLLKPFKLRQVYDKMIKIYNFLNVYRRHKIVLVWSFALSLTAQALYVISMYLLAKSTGVNNVSLAVFFLLIPIIGVIGMLPSINGLGVREASVVYMFKGYIPASTAFAISLLALAMLLGISLIGAFIYIFKKDIYRFKPEMEADVI
jgi:glycosyltransferase 2 family protein